MARGWRKERRRKSGKWKGGGGDGDAGGDCARNASWTLDWQMCKVKMYSPWKIRSIWRREEQTAEMNA